MKRVSQPFLNVFSVLLGKLEKKLRAAGRAVIEYKKTIIGIKAATTANSFTGTSFVTNKAANPIDVVRQVYNTGLNRFWIRRILASTAFKPLVRKP